MEFVNTFDLFDEVDEIDGSNSRQRKMYKIREDPFQLNDLEFKRKYRFSKRYINKIVDLIKDDIKQSRRGGGISPELQVLTAVRTWARQEVQDDAADLHGLSQQSVTNVCRRVATALGRRAANFIYMPSSISEQEEVISGFREICGFRNVIGAIDCTHVRIKKVGGDLSQFYINRKGYPSLNVQVICDSKLKIRDIVARWRGSTHDSRIFRESAIRDKFLTNQFCGRLIGDSGYGLTPYLFTPVLNPATHSEEAYNKAHIRTRNTVERCFGIWKQRFRCLLTGFTVSLENAKLYIVALAVLHNIAIDMGEEVEDIMGESQTEVAQPLLNVADTPNETRLGQIARRLFIERYF